MQVPTFAVFTAATFAVFTAVSAERSVVVQFNNGVSPYWKNPTDDYVIFDETVGECSPQDLELTYAILMASGQNSTYGFQRYLRTNKMVEENDMTGSKMLTGTNRDRELAFPRKCKNLCSGVATGYCQAPDCNGYRRRDLSSEQSRDLTSGVAFTCTQQVNYINTELDRLVSQNLVSESCKTLLSNPRGISCFDDVIYGAVEQFELWTNYPYGVISDNYNMCYGQMMAIKVAANDCVNAMRTTLTGPNNYFRENVQQSLPFTIFGDIGTDGLLMETLPNTGRYTLTAIPDGFVDKTKSVTFNVVASQVLGISLYDTKLKKMNTTNFVSGNTVCVGRSFSWEFNIDDCASSNRATLTGPAGFTMRESKESLRPFTMYGLSNYVMVGKTLTTIGNYTLTVYPGQIVSDGVKVIQFRAVKC